MELDATGRPKKRERKFVTLRLLEEDKTLLQNLGAGRVDRYTALTELTALVPTLALPEERTEKRKPLRLGIPTPLAKAIKMKQKQTGLPFVTILLECAKAYQTQHKERAKL